MGNAGDGRAGPKTGGVLETVSVPAQFESPFRKAQDYVSRYFEERVEHPRDATIKISGERYVLVRAASLSRELFSLVASLYRDRGEDEARRAASGFLFDIAHVIGKADAKSFHARMKVEDPIEKLSAGPIHFAYTGWAFVKIHEESRPSPDESYFLVYDHPFSFEAEEWMKAGGKTEHPVCIMNAGYSSGWCEESFGLHLVAVEITCRARGDDHCRFVMAPPSKIEGHLARLSRESQGPGTPSEAFTVPEFFERKRLEDDLRMSEETARALLNATGESALLVDETGTILAVNETAARSFAMRVEDLVGRNGFEVLPPDLGERRKTRHSEVVRSGKPVVHEEQRDGRWLRTTLTPVFDDSGKVARVAIFSRDITDTKKAEEERVEKEKLRSVLEMAGAICHELSQPLTAVSGYVALISRKTSMDGPEQKRIEQLTEQIERMSGIMGKLLKITRYETRDYVDGVKIIDLDRSSDPEP